MLNPFSKYFILCAFSILLGELAKYILNVENLFYLSLAETLNNNQIKEIFALQKKWLWVSNIIIPLLLLIKTFLITCVLYICLFFYKGKQFIFKSIWELVLQAEYLFLIVPFFNVIYFYFFQDNYTLQDIQYFYPLSALQLLGYEGLEPWYIYPLQTLNLFEVAYIFFLAYQIGKLVKSDLDFGLTVVLYSYVPALLFWVSVIMFFTLNYS
jgi:hypothetical protein